MKSEQTRILFVSASMAGGGSERVLLTILDNLDRQRFEPHLALVNQSGSLLDDIPSDVPVHDLNAGRARYALGPVVRLVWSLHPRIVFSTLGPVNLVLILGRPLFPRGTKVLLREGTSVSAHLAMGNAHPRFWRWVYRQFYNKTDKVICQSNYMLEDLATALKVPRDKILRIYNPVDTDEVIALGAAENRYEGPGPHLVSAGRLSAEKGYDFLLDSMALIVTRHPTACLTLVGEGPLEESLRSQRDRLGLNQFVRFAGFQANPYPFFKHADLFLLCSRYEGLPNVVLEALSLGTPVVAVNCPGGLEEIAAVDSRLRLVAPGSPQAFATVVSEILAQRSTWKESRNHSRLLETFGVETVLNQYQALFAGMANVS